MRNRLPTSSSMSRQQGFSMLEVLITLILVAIALLGTAGLQVLAMKAGKSSYFRTQAVFLSSDIAERMQANSTAAIAGNYSIAQTNIITAAAADCTQAPCNATSLASFDLNQWETAITTLLPQPTWSITQTTTGSPSTFNIVIGWTDRSSDKNSHGETFSFTANRSVR